MERNQPKAPALRLGRSAVCHRGRAGHRGGEGTPEEVAENPASYTGQFLRDVLRVELAAD